MIKELNEALAGVKTGYADVAVNKTSPVIIAEHEEHFLDRILEAAKLLSDIYPDILEMVEAREKATEGEWGRDDGFVVWINPSWQEDKILGTLDRNDYSDAQNNRFITTSANATSRIAERIKDE